MGQHTQALNNSPSYTVQDGFHLLELHGETSIKFILIILVVALIALAVKLGLRKRKVASTGQPFISDSWVDQPLLTPYQLSLTGTVKDYHVEPLNFNLINNKLDKREGSIEIEPG